MGDTPLRETPVRDTPVRETPLRDTLVRDTPLRETPMRDTTVGETPLSCDLMIVSYISMTSCTTPLHTSGIRAAITCNTVTCDVVTT